MIKSKRHAFGLALVAALACGSTQAAPKDDLPTRRYLNEVFDDFVKTADIVFAEEHNATTGKVEKLTMRVFEPKGDKAAKRTLFVLTPGGAFVRHEDYWMDQFGEQLARAGYVVAINRYRLSDSIATPAQYIAALSKAYLDQKAAIQFLLKDAKGANRFRIDPDNVFIGGHSAGGITSMHVAYLDADDHMTKLLEGPAAGEGGTESSNSSKKPLKIRGVINMSGLLTDLDILDKGEPPLMSMHGDQDQVVNIGTEPPGLFGSIPIHERAEAIGLTNQLHVIRGAGHNDTSDPVLCPECIPLAKRFMFNNMSHRKTGTK